MATPPPQRRIPIAGPSVKSLLLEMRFNGRVLATGTGFVADAPRGPMLITSRHNVTGRHQDTGQLLHSSGAVPNELVVNQNRLNHAGQWVPKLEPLLDINGSPTWIEHPTLGA